MHYLWIIFEGHKLYILRIIDNIIIIFFLLCTSKIIYCLYLQTLFLIHAPTFTSTSSKSFKITNFVFIWLTAIHNEHTQIYMYNVSMIQQNKKEMEYTHIYSHLDIEIIFLTLTSSQLLISMVKHIKSYRKLLLWKSIYLSQHRNWSWQKINSLS